MATKKINGRKRHIVVDTLGLLLCIVVTGANIHDSIAAETVFKRMKGKFPRLKKYSQMAAMPETGYLTLPVPA